MNKMQSVGWFTFVSVFVLLLSYTSGELLTAYLVGNSHDDVGWQDTIDGYYEKSVRGMFTTTVDTLSLASNRKFVYCEIAFFSMWWTDNRTTANSKSSFLKLLANKQVEFVIGGWVMNDEGNPSYSAIIDQLTEGHQFLKEQFNVVPQYMWQIDPSGLTSAMPTIASYANMKGHLIDRINWQVRAQLQNTKHMEFMWQGSPSLGNKTRIFTHILYELYCTPYQTFNWATDNVVNSTNVKSWADQMVAHVKLRQTAYLTSHVLVPWVCDFEFVKAAPMYSNMDRIIQYINQHSSDYNVTIKYALLSEYFEAVQSSGVTFPDYLNQDFLPYYVNANGWRTGFYTSRPEFKGLVREKEATLRSIDSILALSTASTPNNNISFIGVQPLRRAVAEVQHHDAVVGTMREFVLADYIKDLTNAAGIAYQTSAKALQQLLKPTNTTVDLPLVAGSTPLLTLQKGQTGVINAYNSLGWDRKDFIRVPLNLADVSVLDTNGNKVSSQVLPALEYNAAGKYNLFFEANIPALGYNTFFVVSASSNSNEHHDIEVDANAGDFILKNSVYQVTVANSTGRISNIQNIFRKVPINIDHNFLVYHSFEGTTMQKSDPYFMSVTGPAVVLSTTPPLTKLSVGAFVQELYQEFYSNESTKSFAKQIVRLYNTPSGVDNVSNYIEVYHEIGILPPNRELITQYSTSIGSGATWFTDENGYEEMKRTRNTQADQPIPANYYPGVYTIRISDAAAQLTVVSERTHSVSSQSTGQLQLMLHRRITTCPCEISEPLNDTTITTPVLRLLLDSPSQSPLLLHTHSYMVNFPPMLHTGVSKLTPTEWVKTHRSVYTPLTLNLPLNVHLLSFKVFGSTPNQFLLRFTHIFAVGEDPTYSQPATVNVGSLFGFAKIKSFQETSLTANQVYGNSPLSIQLYPKEIKTYLVSFQ